MIYIVQSNGIARGTSEDLPADGNPRGDRHQGQ